MSISVLDLESLARDLNEVYRPRSGKVIISPEDRRAILSAKDEAGQPVISEADLDAIAVVSESFPEPT